MNDPNQTFPIFDEFNAMCGFIVAVFSYIFGEHWFLFVAFLVMNVLDYVTGCLKARINNKTNSSKGAVGIFKKLGYWLMILMAFGAGAVFIEIGEVIGVNLGVTTLIGWFVLAALIINEARSIIENFIEAGYEVPDILSRGLEVADKIVKNKSDNKKE